LHRACPGALGPGVPRHRRVEEPRVVHRCVQFRRLIRPQPRHQRRRQPAQETERRDLQPRPSHQHPGVPVLRPPHSAKPRLRVVPVRGVRPRHAGAALRRAWPGAFPAVQAAPPVRHRRRLAGAARCPRLRPAAPATGRLSRWWRQVGVAARIAVAQSAGAIPGSRHRRARDP
jgi:hypothetical protein